MKQIKKMIALVIAMVMVLAMGVTVFAAETGTITVTPPTGVDAAASNSYKVYKVFDATVDATDNTKVSYKLCSGDTLSADMIAAGFSVDSAGNVSYSKDELDATAIAAIAAYVTESDLVATLTATGTTAVTSSALGYGYYYITTSTGTVVTIDSNNNNPTVDDKNTVPGVDKKITGASSVDEDGKKALAQVGTTVNYSAEITIGKGAKDYIFHDTMETGLTYNNDAAVTGVEAGATTYTVGKEGDDTFTITFNNDYIKTLAVGSKITVTYSAKVNDDAITTDPLNNTCYVSYGDANSNNKTPTSEADVYEAKFTVTKKDGKGEPLEGAGFVIKNSENKYYKIEGKVVSWVNSIDDATEYKSNASGEVQSFTGLANGTYTLVEKTVPTGYNKAADSTFTIAKHDYTADNLEQKATVTNNAGAELPSTGGIGTTIFYIVGAILVLGAGILLVTRRRMSAN
jgi:fimbrial isopeptide formation D2 family protein/LPXTG-motif cell wall-anchored protein